MKKRAAIFCNALANVNKVYGAGRRERLAALTDLHPEIISLEAFEDTLPSLAGLEVVFSTWGMPALTAGQIARLPELKAVFYGAGSVQGFARPFLESGIQVVSAWGANAVPVAEFTLAQVLLGCKGYFRRMREGAVFINTGRGATVEEPEMIAALQQRPDITALLDVTFPEPPAPDSPIYSMPNVQLRVGAEITSHFAAVHFGS